MNRVSNRSEILIMSSYPPRECGIATYTRDLFEALTQSELKYTSTFTVCALEKGDERFSYLPEVRYSLNTSRLSDYAILASQLNRNANIRIVVIQHEFGLFSGPYGSYLFSFLKAIKKPVWINFHTVLPAPEPILKNVVKRIVGYCDQVMVMTNMSRKILIEEYGIPQTKIVVIPHGTHPIKLNNKESLKAKYLFKNRTIVSTFGLISDNKSIETALDALPAVVRQFPDLLYLVIGKTHPEVVKSQGETYRNFLEEKVSALGLKHNVLFINRYLDRDELLELLQMTDVYLFTSKDPLQAVSGTLAFALSCGCPVVSTAMPHAKEILSEDTGILVDFKAPQMLGEALMRILSNPNLQETMSKNALLKSRASQWPNVAARHITVLKKYLPVQSLVLSFPLVLPGQKYKLAN